MYQFLRVSFPLISNLMTSDFSSIATIRQKFPHAEGLPWAHQSSPVSPSTLRGERNKEAEERGRGGGGGRDRLIDREAGEKGKKVSGEAHSHRRSCMAEPVSRTRTDTHAATEHACTHTLTHSASKASGCAHTCTGRCQLVEARRQIGARWCLSPAHTDSAHVCTVHRSTCRQTGAQISSIYTQTHTHKPSGPVLEALRCWPTGRFIFAASPLLDPVPVLPSSSFPQPVWLPLQDSPSSPPSLYSSPRFLVFSLCVYFHSVYLARKSKRTWITRRPEN